MLQLAPVASPHPAATSSRQRLGLTVAVIGVCAALLSLLGSWSPSLWGDEAASLLSARRPLASLFMMLGHVDAVHGFYYLLLHFWVDIAGTSPFMLRLPSALAVGVAAAAVAWICARLHSMRLAIVAGSVAAVLPRLTDVGEEVRGYAFDAALAAVLIAIVAEIVVRRHASWRLWAAYAVVLTAATYMFLYDVLMSLAVVAFLLVTPSLRSHLRAWAIATACSVAACAPVIVFALLERGQVSYLANRSVVTVNSVFVTMWFGQTAFAVLAWALILLAIVAYVVKALRDRRSHTWAAPRGVEAAPSVVLLATCWLVLPVGILIATSPVLAGYTARYGTFAAPAAAILIGAGLLELARHWWAAVIVGAALAVTVVPIWLAQRGPYGMNQSDWNEIAATVSAHARSGDGIVFDEGSRPSRRTRLAMDTDPSAFTNVKDLTLESPYSANPTWHDDAYSVSSAAALGRLDGIDRVWMVEYSTGSNTDTWGISSLESLGYHETARYVDHRSVVYLFSR